MIWKTKKVNIQVLSVTEYSEEGEALPEDGIPQASSWLL